jgi:hypothetical protein
MDDSSKPRGARPGMRSQEKIDPQKEGSDKPDKANTKVHLHTTISPSTMDRLQALSTKFGPFSKIIERAVEMLSVRENLPAGMKRIDLDSTSLWCMMRSELNMVAVGKTTFLSYISGMPRKAFTENIAVEIIEWFYDFKNISELSTLEILVAIQRIWTSGNYFREFRIEEKPDGAFRVVVTHDLNHIKYSEFWATYFQVLFSEKLQRQVTILFRPQIFYLEIRDKP